jgi:hypothetical protein
MKGDPSTWTQDCPGCDDAHETALAVARHYGPQMTPFGGVTDEQEERCAQWHFARMLANVFLDEDGHQV